MLLALLRSPQEYHRLQFWVLIFLLFINDIHENLDSIFRLFADDASLYRSINTMNDSVILQSDINKFVSWSKT